MSDEKMLVLVMIALNCVVMCLLERLLPLSPAPGIDRRHHLGANLTLTGLLIALNFALDRTAAAGGRSWSAGFALLRGREAPGWAKVLVVVVALDGMAYLAHVLMHKVPAAWRFHRVHHSDQHIDVTTAFRQHPLETVWRYSFQLVGALVLGASSRSVAIYLALSALAAQFEHAHLSLPRALDGSIRVLCSTPAMHRVHHSRAQAETDTNYSNIFSFWDRLFGTYRAPRPGEEIECGLDGYDRPEQQKATGLLVLPFGP